MEPGGLWVGWGSVDPWPHMDGGRTGQRTRRERIRTQERCFERTHRVILSQSASPVPTLHMHATPHSLSHVSPHYEGTEPQRGRATLQKLHNWEEVEEELQLTCLVSKPLFLATTLCWDQGVKTSSPCLAGCQKNFQRGGGGQVNPQS